MWRVALRCGNAGEWRRGLWYFSTSDGNANDLRSILKGYSDQRWVHARDRWDSASGTRDEQGIAILWLMQTPLYGQADAGTIWNRTYDDFAPSRKQYLVVGTSKTHHIQISTVGAAAPRLAGCSRFIGCALASVAGSVPPPPPPPPTAPLDAELFHREGRIHRTPSVLVVEGGATARSALGWLVQTQCWCPQGRRLPNPCGVRGLLFFSSVQRCARRPPERERT